MVRPEEGHQADVAVPPEEVLHPEARLQALRRRQIAATANNRKSGFNSGCKTASLPLILFGRGARRLGSDGWHCASQLLSAIPGLPLGGLCVAWHHRPFRHRAKNSGRSVLPGFQVPRGRRRSVRPTSG